MTKTIGTLWVVGALILLPVGAIGDDDGPYGEPAATAVDPVTPATPAPSEAPPPPAQYGSVPAGQWVYTWQYGWVWMPYGSQYASVPDDGWGAPYLYVYYPLYGWCWIDAPWVWGIGPWPDFGFYGAAHFAWYADGWWRQPWRWHYAPARGVTGFRGAPGRPLAGPVVRPAPFRAGGFGARVSAPYGRPAAPRFGEGLGRGEARGFAGGGYRGGGRPGGFGGGGRFGGFGGHGAPRR